jgi:cytochrome P450
VPFLDGDRHKTRKRLLLTAFTPEALGSYLPGIFMVLERFVKQWTTEREVAGDLSQLGFDVADYLFAGSDPSTSNTAGAADFALMNKGTFSPPVNLPFTAYGKAIKARDRLRIYIKQQVALPPRTGTALGVLKAARGPAGEALTADELEIELLHFFFAAHGGLTAAIAWLLVVLGEHPELAARVRGEADGLLGATPPTYADIQQLAKARAVSREVLRAYPIAPVTFLGVARKDLELDGFHIRAGWKGAGAIWATLQDGSTFRDPTQFRDDRLGDAALGALPANAFVPQGGGPPEGHRCPGEALIQLVRPAFLGWFAKRYDLIYPKQDAAPGGGGLGPLPRSGVRISVKPRSA